jgi:peptidoglycan/LPS O-acetylase OafA/YrhL
MQPTKAWSLVLVAVCSAAVAWLVALGTFANLPPLPWTVVPGLALLAFGELLLARNLRSRLRVASKDRSGPPLTGRPGVKPIDPMSVPRIVALAKASSAAAAVFGGLAAGFCIYTLASLGKPVARHDALVCAFTAAAAIALLAAALYLERCCRSPEPPEDSDDDMPYPNGQHGREC